MNFILKTRIWARRQFDKKKQTKKQKPYYHKEKESQTKEWDEVSSTRK